MNPAQITTWHSQQQGRVIRKKVSRPEIPTDYNCAGECTQAPPPVPAATQAKRIPVPRVIAGFMNPPPSDPTPTAYWIALAVAVVGFVALTRWSKR